MRDTFDFSHLFRSSVGFDRMLDTLDAANRVETLNVCRIRSDALGGLPDRQAAAGTLVDGRAATVLDASRLFRMW